jgi:N-acetylmuramoyl-L-alanine amidase
MTEVTEPTRDAVETGSLEARPVIRHGSRHEAVAELREILTHISLLPLDAACEDPHTFDSTLDSALRHFQQSNGLTVDGVVGPLTWRRALEARWQLGDRPLAYSPERGLLAGDDVAALQRKLSDLGFNCGRVDGMFGLLTDAALRDFQGNIGIVVDGICGPETLRAFANLSRAITGGRPEALREAHDWDHRQTGVFGKVIVIDPGHGDDDEGCVAHSIVERDVVVDIAERMEKHLAPLGVVVLLTRGRSFHHGRALDDAARAEFANSVAADAVISLHVDDIDSVVASGVSAFFYGADRHGSHSDSGQNLAESILRHVCSAANFADLGAYPKTWDLLRITRMPAVRLYLGYASNPEDARRLGDADFRELLADRIAAAVVNCFTPVTASA